MFLLCEGVELRGVVGGKRMALSVILVYNTFWIATVKIISAVWVGQGLSLWFWQQGFCSHHWQQQHYSNRAFGFSHGHSLSTNLREAEVAVTASITGRLLLRSKILSWAPELCSCCKFS